MPPPSLERRLLALWLSIFAVAAVLAWLVFALGREGSQAQVSRAEQSGMSGCEGL
ncbi:MAG: hypothetical protein H0U56_04910 [Methylibium sp.]|nr:hypothetical protein [Methylibium sp.]